MQKYQDAKVPFQPAAKLHRRKSNGNRSRDELRRGDRQQVRRRRHVFRARSSIVEAEAAVSGRE